VGLAIHSAAGSVTPIRAAAYTNRANVVTLKLDSRAAAAFERDRWLSSAFGVITMSDRTVLYRRPMSVELDFQPEPRAAAEALATDPAELFTETLLLVRVRFRVDGVDLLPPSRLPVTIWSVDQRGIATGSEPVVEDHWPWQPVIGLLLGLERAVEDAQRTGVSRCYLTEQSDLVFTRRPVSMLEVASQGGATVAAAQIDEFTAAITGFREAVRTWLEGQAPHLATHPAWGDWFPGRR
jgi:hypothetical protein